MLADLAFGLAERGHDVAVVTSRLDYENPVIRLPARESVRGVAVIRVPTTGFGRNGLVGRAVDYLTFYLSIFWQLVRHVRPGDLIVAMTDPPLVSVIAGPAAWLRGARFGNWLQDIFPEVATALGLGRGAWTRWYFSALQVLRDSTLRRAAFSVVIGERMAEHVRRLGVPDSHVVYIPNWADRQRVVPIDHERNRLRREWALADAFVVGYSGNLGRAHDADTILAAIAWINAWRAKSAAPRRLPEVGSAEPSLPLDPPINWLFVGGGAQMARLQSKVEVSENLSVQFRPYQPRERLAESLSVPDVHLVSLRPELEGFIVPSKYYGIAAAGRPAIFIGDIDGEIARILRATKTGLIVAQGDGEGLAQAIIQLSRDPQRRADYGVRARTLAESVYDLSHALSAWDETISRFSPASGRVQA